MEPSSLQSFESTRWYDQYGNPLGITLSRGSVVAVVPEGDEGAFGEPRTYQSDGPLFAALSADGLLILPEPEWLASPLTAGELEALLASRQGNGWEAYSVRHWKPASRGAALFNFWD
ncbi:hypothetical protein [Deinococcus planocerae]|uniref:hypothetical protein n=1 Tax=Deinococcus planocerae TaxID=1737569 RepID=UPI000C7EAEA3|nr:hypothetical protein [Deinococcus planocerae]